MTNLAIELKELFTDYGKSSNMMDEECFYAPEVPDYDYSKGYNNRKLIGTKEVFSGYGKELTEIGVTFDNVDSYGGEGKGDQYWCVWEFTRGDEVVCFKFDGWYASYDGATFEDVFEVIPKQKTITVWED